MKQSTIQTVALRLGIISGVLGIIAYLILYRNNIHLLFQWVGFMSFVTVIPFMVASGIHARIQLQASQVSFKTLLQPIFLTFIIFLGFLIIFQYLMYNAIDTTIAEQFKNYYIEQQREQMQAEGMTERKIKHSIIALEKGDWGLGLANSLKQFIGFLIPGFFISVFISLLLKFVPLKMGDGRLEI